MQGDWTDHDARLPVSRGGPLSRAWGRFAGCSRTAVGYLNHLYFDGDTNFLEGVKGWNDVQRATYP